MGLTRMNAKTYCIGAEYWSTGICLDGFGNRGMRERIKTEQRKDRERTDGGEREDTSHTTYHISHMNHSATRTALMGCEPQLIDIFPDSDSVTSLRSHLSQ